MSGPRIERYRHHLPSISASAFVHESAIVIGEVTIGPYVSVWPSVVLRGDQGGVFIGAETNIQDGTIAHATGGVSQTRVGKQVTVGHRVLLHGCTVEDRCLIGMGAILLDNCHIGEECLIGAGALVPVGRVIPPRSLVLGVPGKVVRTLTDKDIEDVVLHGHREYMKLAEEYRK